MKVLHAIRINDLSRVLAVPYCAQTMADSAAAAIEIEGL